MNSTMTITTDVMNNADRIGKAAEAKVFKALETLTAPWVFYQTVEWRTLGGKGEQVGEADAVVFHHQYGLAVLEIKAGAVEVVDGVWQYATKPMKQSPFEQARYSRFALLKKLRILLGEEVANTLNTLSMTHAVWFPDLQWKGPIPSTDAPSRDFVLDKDSLAEPEKALLRLFKAACPNAEPWNGNQRQALKQLLAPDCRQLVPLSTDVDGICEYLHKATEQQVQILRLLRTQKRLLVEGSAGSGKTALAVALAREHAAQGKHVLFTCYNVYLAQHIQFLLADVPGVVVRNFHELVKDWAKAAKISYIEPLPAETAKRTIFFNDTCPDLLDKASTVCPERFDSIIVDEAADFLDHWWVALETLGAPDFSYYCFYDTHQAIFQSNAHWSPPFKGEPMLLTANLRNTRPIGELAAQLGKVPVPTEFRVDNGPAPEILTSPDFIQMGRQLRKLLQRLINNEGVAPERIVLLSHHRHTSPVSKWSESLKDEDINTNMSQAIPGKVRVGTIQGFKGLEADVVILVGIDEQASARPEWLYVGASRARGALFVLKLEAL